MTRSAKSSSVQTHVLQEHLGYEWRDELVAVPWSGALPPCIADDGGKELPVQLAAGQAWFMVDRLPAFGRREFLIGEASVAALPKCSACASASAEGDTQVLSNGRIAVRVPGARDCAAIPVGQVLPAPMLQVCDLRAPSVWIGRGELTVSPDAAIVRIVFTPLQEGVHWCIYEVRYETAAGAAYRVELRLRAGASHVEIAETSTLCHDAAWTFDIYPGLAPASAVSGHHPTSTRTTVKPLVFDGSMHLGDLQAPEQNMHFFTDDFETFAFAGADRALCLCVQSDADWTFIPQNPIRMLPLAGPRLELRASCKAGARRWALLLADAGETLRADYPATPIMRLRRKYETTLHDVSRQVLAWDEDPKLERPASICTPADLKRARRLFAEYGPMKRYGEFIDREASLVLGQYHSDGHYPLDDKRREDPVCAWLMKPDPAIAARLKDRLLQGIKTRVDVFLGPEGHRHSDATSINVGRLLRPFMHIYDILGERLPFAPEELRYFKAAAAFLAYKINDRNYWNAEAIVLHSDHPKSAHRNAWFPSRDSDFCTYNIDTAPHNFHQDLYTALGAVALVFPGHPQSKDWLDQTLLYLEQELDNFIFRTGAYIESATYTLGTMGWMMPFLAQLKNRHVRNYLLDERLQRLFYALARLLGPCDRRLGRHSFMVMGDAMYPSNYGNILAWAAFLGREDEAFSATMMDAWKKTGCQLNHPGQQGQSMYDALFIDPDLPSQPLPELPSEHFKGLGLVLRHAHGTKDEVYFFLKCGKIYSHFHYDEGSFVAFADGVPIMDEYGIQYGSGTDEDGRRVPGNAPRCHNAISFSNTPTDRECYNRGDVTRFMAESYADYAVCEMPVHLLYMKPGFSLWGFQGEEAPYGWWRRHILFIKPHGFFFYDQVESEFPATLDLNFKADSFRAVAGLSRVYKGRYGTDIPVCINAPAGGPVLDGRIDMKANENSFPKFSTMESAPKELKDTFYNQLSMHVKAPPNSDFSWAFAWARPEAGAVLEPLGQDIPGSVLRMAGGVTRAVVAPAFLPAVKVNTADMAYTGRAGAVTAKSDGTMELIQMSGSLIGGGTGPRIQGEGPFRAVLRGRCAEIEVGGPARWLEVDGVDVKSASCNGEPVRCVLSPSGRLCRIAVAGGMRHLSLEWV